jgi:hypothetical protein
LEVILCEMRIEREMKTERGTELKEKFLREFSNG